jgi:NAD(P)-dependent dehydrogenase (short-subunit alcohol dehydrogenase family)
MTTTLITGANKALGKETARQLIAGGHTVWIGARDEARGRAAAKELGSRFVQLDVTDDASLAIAYATVEATADSTSLSTMPVSHCSRSGSEALKVFGTNAVGTT